MVLLHLIHTYVSEIGKEMPLVLFLEEEQFPELREHFEKMVIQYKLTLVRVGNLHEFQKKYPQIKAICIERDTKNRSHWPKTGNLLSDLEFDGRQVWPDYVLVNPLLGVPFCRLYKEGYTSKTKKGRISSSLVPSR